MSSRVAIWHLEREHDRAVEQHERMYRAMKQAREELGREDERYAQAREDMRAAAMVMREARTALKRAGG